MGKHVLDTLKHGLCTMKTALVTGSSSGIGLGIATKLSKDGYNVIMTGSRSSALAQSAIEQVTKNSSGGKIVYISADLKSQTGLDTLCAKIQSTGLGIDVLVNNAGMQHVTSVEDCSMEKWSEMLALNLTAPFFLTKTFVPEMKRKGWGRIINISSRMGVSAGVGKSPYCTTKHGLIGMTKAVALETARHGITCNAVCPGWVDTPFVQSQIQAFAERENIAYDEAKKRLTCDSHPTGNVVQVSELADLISFLCSPSGANMTGSSLIVDGGMTAGS